jgi:predicted transposase/invertase (TIGR01784 family)
MKEEYSIEQLQLDKFEQGRLTEKQETARNMLAEGIELDIVAKITKLSSDDLATLSQ